MARRRGPGLVTIAGLLLAALLALVIPLPQLVAPLRPDFVALVVLWLCLLSPRPTGLAVAFLAGLAVDAAHGLLLGQHALSFSVIAYMALKLRLRIRAFPLLQQSAVVFALLALAEFLAFWIDGVTGHAVTVWSRWLGVLVGAACWPLLAGLLERYLPRS
jgi:rod shape-determining protein MreD